MPSNIGTIINGSRGGGGGASLTFSSSDGTLDIVQVGDNVDITLDGGPISVTSADGSVDVDQVGNAIDLAVVSTPQLIEFDGQTVDAVTPLLFTLGTLDSDGDSLAVNLNVYGTSEDGDDIRFQAVVGFNAVRRGGAIVTNPAIFVNQAVSDGAGAGCTVSVDDVSGNNVRLLILGLAATDITWAARGQVTFTPGP